VFKSNGRNAGILAASAAFNSGITAATFFCMSSSSYDPLNTKDT